MSLGPCRLLSLPDEVIIDILSFCSVVEVLRAESTCKSLREKCRDRALWMRLLGKLDVSEAPNLPPGELVSTISSRTLRRMVISAVRAASEWRTEGRLTVVRSLELRIPPYGDSEKGLKPYLLPGGRTMLMENCGRLELWDLEKQDCLWVSPHYEGRDCITFDFELSDDRTSIHIADVFNDKHGRTILRVYTYHFEERAFEFAFEQILQDGYLLCAILRGDLLMSCIPMTSQVILMNWRTGEGVTVDFADRQTSQGFITHVVELVGGYLVSFQRAVRFSAVAVPVSALDGRWTMSRDPDSWQTVLVHANDWPVLTSADEERAPTDPPLIFDVRSFKPTWIKDAPTEIYVASFDRQGYKPTQLVSYRLHLSTLTEPSLNTKSALSLVSVTKAPMSRLPWNPNSLSNAGRLFTTPMRNKVLYFDLFAAGVPQPFNSLVLGADIDIGADEDAVATVEPWSGTIVLGTPGRVRVFYLQD